MTLFSVRRVALASALALVAMAAATGSAQAAVTASTITSPGNSSYYFYNAEATSSSTLFTVSGTTTGSGNVDIDCYDGSGNSYAILTDATVTGNSFTVPITSAELNSANLGGDTCALRAVGTGDTGYYPPGSRTAFSGPAIAVSTRYDTATSGGQIYKFDYYLSDFSGWMDFETPGYCGLYSELVNGTLTYSGTSFDCVGGIYDTYKSETGSTVGPELEVDGIHAFDAGSASTSKSGYQGVNLSESFSAGALTIHDNEPILVCSPSITTCTSYASSGVELDRTWQARADGVAALQTDVFRSVDGHEHSLAVLEDDSISAVSPPGLGLEFPGSAGFQDYAAGANVTLPTGPGTIYFKTNSTTSDLGDGLNPQGAIIYAASPNNGPVNFTEADDTNTYSEFVMPYSRTIPAGGSAVLRFAYIQGYSLSGVQAQVQSLAQTALATFSPVVSISSPANGATVSTSPVTVTGTASDAAGIASVTVNGHAATLGAGGAFAASVPLTSGSNTITATATDTDGITGQQAITVAYKAPPVVTTGKASSVKSSGAKIAGTVNPEGQATTYAVQYGTSTKYGSTSATGSAGSGSSAVSVSSTLSGLKASTTYHYRVIATNASGTSYGSDATFRTGKPAPTGLGAKVSGSGGHYTVKGKLGLPHGISKKKGCAGTITVKVKHGKKTVATKHAKVTKKCTWKTSVTGHGKLKITPSFGGNSVLARLTGKTLTAG